MHLIGLVAILGMMSAMVLVPHQQAEAQDPPPITEIPITGTFEDALGGVGTFEGVFTLDRFARQGGGIVAVGTLTGTATDSAGTLIGSVTDLPIRLPLFDATGTCDILHLELGPLDLDLLGLVVHLDQVVLDIDAESGPGNLLGNLLCAVAGLLDGGASNNALVRLLNQILGLLG